MAQRQFRSDDTSVWAERYGDGSDGALTISANTTDAPIDSSCSGTSGTTSLTATNASFAAGQLILIHQTRGTGVGNWELNKISSYTAGTITTAYSLTNTYTNSGASIAQVIVLKQYSSVTVNASTSWTAKNWTQSVGGILAFLCNGTTTINGSIVVSGSNGGGPYNTDGAGSVTGRGFRNGLADGTDPSSSSTTGEGSAGDRVTTQNTANGSGGGAGTGGAAGGGGGNGAAGGGGGGFGSYGAGGSATGSASLVTMTFGGGGGGGHWPNYAGSGGTGAGIAFIITKSITVHATTGSINANGGNGGSVNNSGGDAPGGGGAGGSVLIKAETATLNTTRITASGGAAGTAASARTAGAGAVGRIHVDYGNTLSGTTTPTLDSTQDTLLSTLQVSVADSATITDQVGYYETEYLGISDTAGITANVTPVNTDTLSFIEATSLYVTPILDRNVSLTDSLSLTDAVEAISDIILYTEETLTFDDIGFVSFPIMDRDLDTTDTLTLDDTSEVFLTRQPVNDDTIIIDDQPQVYLVPIPARTINTSDTVTLTDTATLLRNLLITPTESLVISDNASLQIEVKITISDSITLSDTLTVLQHRLITVIDSLTLTEAVTFSSIYFPATVSDSIIFTEKFALRIFPAGYNDITTPPDRWTGQTATSSSWSNANTVTSNYTQVSQTASTWNNASSTSSTWTEVTLDEYYKS